MKILKKNLIKLTTEYNECHQYSYMEWKHGNEVKNHHCVLTVRTVMTNVWKFEVLITIVNSAFIDLPSTSNISFDWNSHCLLRICLLLQMKSQQIYSGNSLYMKYKSYVPICKQSMDYLLVTWNGGSLFFIYSCSKKPAVRILHLFRIMNIRISLLFI